MTTQKTGTSQIFTKGRNGLSTWELQLCLFYTDIIYPATHMHSTYPERSISFRKGYFHRAAKLPLLPEHASWLFSVLQWRSRAALSNAPNGPLIIMQYSNASSTGLHRLLLSFVSQNYNKICSFSNFCCSFAFDRWEVTEIDDVILSPLHRRLRHFLYLVAL